MKITNILDLPQPFVDAVSSEYTIKPKRYSVTTILKDNREILLSRRHSDEITSDVSDMVWAIFGTAVHKVLETANEQEHLKKEFYMTIPVIDEYELSGICDVYDTRNGEVIDYKVISTFKCLKGEFDDFRKQGIAYCYMLRKLGFKADKATFYMILRDWQGSKAKFDINYPQHQIQKKSFEFTEDDFVEFEAWLQEKFKTLIEDEKLSDYEIPVCCEESRWHTDDIYAVMKKGRKTALKLCKTQEEAENYKAEKGGDFIEFRQGTDRKCAEYCLCAPFCEYYKKNIRSEL